mmetsp:Transcript_1935/g.2972  ORF Transcript_1935/g.2972 Transcript_1935/m.2972 type:complete len:279 (-) Transcript_1935:29-865(-)
MKLVRPFHDKIKKFCQTWEKHPSTAQIYDQPFYDIHVYIRVKCEFYGKSLRRALNFSSEVLDTKFWKNNAAKNSEDANHELQRRYRDGLLHLSYIRSLEEYPSHAGSLLCYVNSFYNPGEGEEDRRRDRHAKHFKQSLSSYCVQLAYHAASWAIYEHMAEQCDIEALGLEYMQLRKEYGKDASSAVEIRNTRKKLENLTNSNKYYTDLLYGIRSRSNTEQNADKFPPIDLLMDRKWPQKLMQCLKDLDDRLKALKDIQTKFEIFRATRRTRDLSLVSY